MEYLKVEGDAYERGLQQARHFGLRALADARHALGNLSVVPAKVPTWARGPFAGSVVSSAGRLYHARHKQTLRSYQGGKFQRALEGMADGWGAKAESLYGFCAFEIEASRFNYTLGCTSVAFAAGATETGRALLTYNHDFPPQFGPFPFVRENRPDEGYASLSLGYPVMLGTICGVTLAALSGSLNHAWVRRLWGGEALPISLLVQDVLDRCATVEEAIEAARAVRVPNGSMMTLVDKAGDRAAIELTPQGAFVRRSKAPVLHTFNAYQTDGARRLEVPIGAVGIGPISGLDIHGANLARQARFEGLGAAHQPKWTMEQIDALMADHGDDGRGCSNTICRHDDALSVTLLSARADPVKGTLEVGLGLACEAELETFSMPAPLRRAA